MARIPVRFKRVGAVLDEEAKARLYESSGSVHSAAETLTDLSYLVKSFLENEGVADQENDEADRLVESSETNCSDSEIIHTLKRLFNCQADDDKVKRSIHTAVEEAFREVGNYGSSSSDFKRRLMARLRDRGFDAGN